MKKIIFIFFSAISFSVFAQDSLLKPLFKKAQQASYFEDKDSVLYYANSLNLEAKKINSLKYQIKAEVLIANAYADQNKTSLALDIYFKAITHSRKINDVEAEANVLNAVGVLYFSQKSYKEAKRFFKEEIHLKEKNGDSLRLCNSLLNMAAISRRLNEFDTASYLLDKVRKISNVLKDSALDANYFNGRAANFFGIFISSNELKVYGNDLKIWDRQFKLTHLRDSAELYWQKALAIWQKQKNNARSVNALFNLGYVFQSKKNFNKALNYYLEAAKLISSPSEKLTIYGNLAELYYDMEKYQASSDYFRKLLELKDSVQQDEITEYDKKLAKQFELETNRKLMLQDMSLSLKNKEIAAQQKQIYFYILIFIILVLIIIGIVFYLGFNRRLNKKIQEAKEKFFTNIMHEIRTPLSMIQAPLKTLKPKLSDEEGVYYINLAERNLVRLNELINQMLDVSRIESSNYKLSTTVGNLDLFLKEVTVNYEKSAAEKNIHFISEMNLKSGLLVFDKDAIEKIVGNLLSNAIKYTPENGTVGIAVNMEDGENDSGITLEVWDTGSGIIKSEQDQIFERFFRSPKSSHKTAGIGIGLSLVRDLVSACKGKISLTSEENKGTRFTVELSLKHPDNVEANIPSGAIEDDKPVILLIEDDKDIIDFVANFLHSKNLSVVKAKNGREAKLLLKNITPDLILTDLMMDEMDGLAFLKEIKGNKGLNHVPVIVLTAKSAAQTRIEVLNAGAQAYLTKPFLPDELSSVIANQLELISKIKSELKSKIETNKPDQKAEEKFTSSEPYTQKLFDLIFKNLDNPDLSVELLADLMATNRSHFQRKIKNLTGYSPSELIKLIRLEKSKEFLLAKKGNVTEVAYMCGFSSQSYFTKCFSQHFGFSPTQVSGQ